MRRFESKRSKEDEKRIANLLCGYWGYNFIELKPNYEVDYALMRFEEVGALLEVRKLNVSYDDLVKFKGCYIAPYKWYAMKKWQEEFNLVMIFAIETDDGIYALIMKPNDGWPQWDKKIKLGGMNEKRDRWDREPLLQIPMKFFRKILDVETVPAEVA